MAEGSDIRATIDRYYGNASNHPAGTSEAPPVDCSKDEPAFYCSIAADGGLDTLASQLATEGSELDIADEQVVESDATLVKLIIKMIMDAYLQKASDIRSETYPGRKHTRIRFRKDGVLARYLELSSKFRSALVSRSYQSALAVSLGRTVLRQGVSSYLPWLRGRQPMVPADSK